MIKVVGSHISDGKLTLVVARRGMTRSNLFAVEKAVTDALAGARVSVVTEAMWKDRDFKVTPLEASYPYSIQVTAHERNSIGSTHMTTISIARDGNAYVWADGEMPKFKIDPPPEDNIFLDPLPFVIQAVAMAMRMLSERR